MCADYIKDINRNYNFRINIINDNKILIDSGVDEWLLEINSHLTSNTGAYTIILKHKNTKHKTNHYHTQGIYDNIMLVFQKIKQHEKRLLCKSNNTRFMALFDKIKC